MIKMLYANGDSYGFGAELGTAHHGIFDDYRRKHCYSGIITNNLKIQGYENNSKQGGSNERIYRRLITDIPKLLTKYKPEEIFCTLTLSSAIRREFCDNHGNYMLFMPHHQPAPPDGYTHMNQLCEVLTSHFSNDSAIYTYNFMIVFGIVNFLKQLKVPYLITYSMLSSWEKDIENSYIDPLQHSLLYNSPRIYREESFMEFTLKNSLKVGPDKHPLEEGHQHWANFLLDYIEKNNLLNNKDL
jgi:hypothetical protein